MKKSILVSLAACFLTLTFVGWTGKITSAFAATQEKRTVTIVDEKGKYVEVPCPVERIVVIPSGLAKIVYALGAEDRIVGVGQNCTFPPALEDKQCIGSWAKPNIELLLQQKPDIVIADGHLKNRDQIEKTGIPVIILSAYSTEKYLSALKILGLILNKEERANELARLIEDYRKIIKARTKKLKPEEKPSVFYEWYKPYFSSSALSTSHENIIIAGGINIAAGEPVRNPLVNAEWILKRNPQIIIRSLYFKGTYPPSDAEKKLKKMRDEITHRPGLSEVDAVKNGKVYIFNSALTSELGSIVGIAYFAKWFHPELFEDIDPESVHKELFQKFYGIELEGTWVYPSSE